MGKKIIDMIHYSLKDIIKELPNIQKQGFNVVQTPVLQPNKFINCDYKSMPWWGQFQVTSISKIGNQFGSMDDLKTLTRESEKYGIDVSVNVVFTHVAGLDSGEIRPHQLTDRELLDNKYFWKSFERITNWKDRNEVIYKSHGLPCLDLKNYDLHEIIIRFLQLLVDCGVKGIRIDSGKSIALPCEGGHFFTRVLPKFKDKLFDYTEVIFEDKWLIDEYSKYTNVLTSSFGSDRNKLVTYSFSHDTDLEFHITDRADSNTLAREYRDICNWYSNVLWYVRPYDETWKYNEDIRRGNCYGNCR